MIKDIIFKKCGILTGILGLFITSQGTCGLLDNDIENVKLVETKGKVFLFDVIDEIIKECVIILKIQDNSDEYLFWNISKFSRHNLDPKHEVLAGRCPLLALLKSPEDGNKIKKSKVFEIDPEEINKKRIEMFNKIRGLGFQVPTFKEDNCDIFTVINPAVAMSIASESTIGIDKKSENKIKRIRWFQSKNLKKYKILYKEIKKFAYDLLTEKNNLKFKDMSDDDFFKFPPKVGQMIVLNYIYTLLLNSDSILGSKAEPFFAIKDLMREAICNLLKNL